MPGNLASLGLVGFYSVTESHIRLGDLVHKCIDESKRGKRIKQPELTSHTHAVHSHVELLGQRLGRVVPTLSMQRTLSWVPGCLPQVDHFTPKYRMKSLGACARDGAGEDTKK